uniref:Uncharacterized protein n=1 Tax=Anguilla anguilla TaxID=7936 RepID=A0A0E9T1K3_ANGAN
MGVFCVHCVMIHAKGAFSPKRVYVSDQRKTSSGCCQTAFSKEPHVHKHVPVLIVTLNSTFTKCKFLGFACDTLCMVSCP